MLIQETVDSLPLGGNWEYVYYVNAAILLDKHLEKSSVAELTYFWSRK